MPYSYDFEKGLQHAAQLHRRQHRKGTDIPYITHLLAVSAIVGEYGGSEEEVIGALLHDAVEDTTATVKDIRSRLAHEVGNLSLEER